MMVSISFQLIEFPLDVRTCFTHRTQSRTVAGLVSVSPWCTYGFYIRSGSELKGLDEGGRTMLIGGADQSVFIFNLSNPLHAPFT